MVVADDACDGTSGGLLLCSLLLVGATEEVVLLLSTSELNSPSMPFPSRSNVSAASNFCCNDFGNSDRIFSVRFGNNKNKFPYAIRATSLAFKEASSKPNLIASHNGSRSLSPSSQLIKISFK